LKTRPRQLVGPLPLDIALTGLAGKNTLAYLAPAPMVKKKSLSTPILGTLLNGSHLEDLKYEFVVEDSKTLVDIKRFLISRLCTKTAGGNFKNFFRRNLRSFEIS
jgi:hypothetical protein